MPEKMNKKTCYKQSSFSVHKDHSKVVCSSNVSSPDRIDLSTVIKSSL